MRRILFFAARPGEGLLTEPTAPHNRGGAYRSSCPIADLRLVTVTVPEQEPQPLSGAACNSSAPWVAEYLHEMAVFPKGKHDDQVDSTAQFLDWFKSSFSWQGIYEYYRMQAESLREPTTATWVRLRAPPGIAAIQTFANQHVNIRPDGTFPPAARHS